MTTMTLDEARRLERAYLDADAAHLAAWERWVETQTAADYAAMCDAETAKNQAKWAAVETRIAADAVTCLCGQVWERGSRVSPCDECS